MQKKCKKICVCQKKAVLLHPLSSERAICNGAIAQLVEQRTENPCVPSSILGGTTKRGLTASFLCQVARISLEFLSHFVRTIIASNILRSQFSISVAPRKEALRPLFCAK